MAHLLTCQDISKSFGAQTLFSHISLSLDQGERLGMIGPNGSGKSTLLKIMAGLEEADEGRIFKGKQTKIVYLEQQEDFSPTATVLTVLEEAACHFPLSEQQARIQRIIGQCRFAEPEAPISSLSGGWQKRLALAVALIQEPELLLLDEPTNHLDIDAILWLEGLVTQLNCAMVIISHDRYFLENCCNRILEVNSCYPDGLLTHRGNYSKFLEKRELFLTSQAKAQETMANKVRREVAWLRRGPKARTSKARYRIDQAHELQDELGQLRRQNQAKGQMQLDLHNTGRQSKKLLTAHKISKAYQNQKLFSNLSLELGPGSCLGLVGANGCGKSTLMHILAGSGEPDSGTIKRAQGLRVVHFDQKRSELNQEQTLRQALCPAGGDHLNYQDRSIHVVSWAKRFLFRPDQLDMPVSHLSGGEQARILLARLMLQPADILLLDEPTNDLDIDAITVLEEAISEFPGAVVLVSHDRAFLGLAQALVGFLPRGEEATLFADLEQWQKAGRQSEQGGPGPAKKGKKERKKKSRVQKLSFREEQELAAMEGSIEAAEEEIARCQEKVTEPLVMADSGELSRWCDQLSAAQARADELFSRWQELEEKKERLASG
ncbi:MAG: ABC-F family ATP-binding cassette domain-containing protein [Thermodesulfobacteriota bacterium]